MEILVERRAETLDVLHAELFGGCVRKRAVNRLGELCSGGYLIRTVVDVPTEAVPQNVYTLSAKGRRALELRSPAAVEMFAGRRFNETLRTASLPHQIVTNRAADRLGVRLTPEHLLPAASGPAKVRPDGAYLAGGDDEPQRSVWLEVDLGHYSKLRLLEKVRAAELSPETRGLLLVCPTSARADRVFDWLDDEGASHSRLEISVLTLDELSRDGLPAALRPAATANPDLPDALP